MACTRVWRALAWARVGEPSVGTSPTATTELISRTSLARLHQVELHRDRHIASSRVARFAIALVRMELRCPQRRMGLDFNIP